MEDRFPHLPANRQIQEEAAAWLVELNAGATDPESREQFDAWLRASPAHIRAYLELLPLWHDSAALSKVIDLSREELNALVVASDTNVTTLRAEDNILPATTSSPRSDSRTPRFANTRKYAIAATVLIFVVGALLVSYFRSGVREYSTEIAEVRQLTLSDGTRITIGARSDVGVQYTDTERKLFLSDGDLFLDVAKDPARPLSVIAGTHVVRALGTVFEVRFNERNVRVAVIEGHVAVSRSAAPSHDQKPVLLQSGQQLTARAGGALETPQPIKSKEPAAWRSGRLIFEDATLAEVIDEFNRYNTRPLILEDSTLARIPISAAFSSTDATSLVRFLRDQPDLEVTESGRGIRIGARSGR
jgi:transmembrane sensor